VPSLNDQSSNSIHFKDASLATLDQWKINGLSPNWSQVPEQFFRGERVYSEKRPCGLGILEPSSMLVTGWNMVAKPPGFVFLAFLAFTMHASAFRVERWHILRRMICICPVMGTCFGQVISASFFCLSSGYPTALRLCFMSEYNHTAKYITS
jgi:hypothetical protein